MTDTLHQDILHAKFVLNRYRIVFATLALVVIGLSSCAGGKSGTDPLSDKNIRKLTGMTAPVETPAVQNGRAPGIASRSDSLIFSTMYVETSDVALPTFSIRAQCAGTRCTFSEPRIGYTRTVTLSELQFVAVSADAVGTKHGITLMSGNRQSTDTEFTSFGAWMEHGSFVVQTERGVFPDIRINVAYSNAMGDLTGSRPTGSATWLGLMVGTPATGNNFGDRLQGDAALNYDMSAGGGLDVAFSSIKNIDRGTAHTTPLVLFTDVPISSRGTFEAGFAGQPHPGRFLRS